jgi:hypothetical protein
VLLSLSDDDLLLSDLLLGQHGESMEVLHLLLLLLHHLLLLKLNETGLRRLRSHEFGRNWHVHDETK